MLMWQSSTPLPEIKKFTGAGIYAIFYPAETPLYPDLTLSWPRHRPVYVEKAIPAGGRSGVKNEELLAANPSGSTALFSRLQEHHRSISAAVNLSARDFGARWLVTEDIWIALGEGALLRHHRPIWNTVVAGFGNHDPGRGRRAGMRSRWDTLHPGRPWAPNFAAREESSSQIEQALAGHLQVASDSGIPPQSSTD